MPKKLFVANWKMNPVTLEEGEMLFTGIADLVKGSFKENEIVICPPFLFLGYFNDRFSYLKLGGQDCSFLEKGALTGEVSAVMLKNMGASYVIIGHSERRLNFFETDELINKKMRSGLSSGLNPILCVGETEGQRKDHIYKEVIEKQIEEGLKGINMAEFPLSQIAIAYEPIWAIGTNNPCGIKEAKEMREFIKEKIDARILYGGSVNSENSKGYLEEAGYDGLLVGGASLKPEEFSKIVRL